MSLIWNGRFDDRNSITFLPQNWFTDPRDLTAGLPYTEGRKAVNGGSFTDGDISRYKPLEHLRYWVPHLAGKLSPIVVLDWKYCRGWECCGPWLRATMDAVTEFGGGDGRTFMLYDLADGFMAYDLIDGYAVSMNGVPELLRQRRGLLEWRANNPHYRRGSIVPVFHPTEPWITEAMTYRGMEIARAALPDASTAIMWANPAQEGVEASQFTLQLWGLLWDQTWERKAGA